MFLRVIIWAFPYKVTVNGPGGKETLTYYWWLVPYLGIVKMQNGGISEQLTSFAIGGGTITQDTDTDGDGLNDGDEVNTYDTDPKNEDTDGDELSDGDEIAIARTPKTRIRIWTECLMVGKIPTTWIR